MPDYDNEQIRLSKLHTSPKKGYKLGTASATWKKIKSATATSGTTNPSNNSSVDESDTEASEERAECIDYGSNGELLIIYPNSNVLEVWDWLPPSNKIEGDTLYLHGQVELSITSVDTPSYDGDYDNGEMASEGNSERSIGSFKFLKGSLKTGISILILSKINNLVRFEIHEIFPNCTKSKIKQILFIPDYLQLPNEAFENRSVKFTVKSSDNFIIIGNNDGFLYMYKYDSSSDKYLLGNFDSNLQSIKKCCSQPILNNCHLTTKLSAEEVLLQTSCHDNKPIFDIIGNWLVYSPTRCEYKHLKTVNTPNSVEIDEIDPVILTADQDLPIRNLSMFTPVKLPPPGPLLNRVLSTLSNTALDGLFKLSEVSSNKVRAYLNREKQHGAKSKIVDKDMIQSLNSIGKTIGKILYSTASTTASTIQKSARNLKPNNNQLINIIDLSNDKIMTTFKPPGGISNLSLSPYDLQLVHSSLRGDVFFMWDLYKLPTEISLIGKFIRGKTSAIIEEILWFINNYDTEINGNNSGFGCITKSTGSVHWFNINYLSGNLTNNYPNILGKENVEENIKDDKFLDSWILSSLDAKKFVKLPNISNFNKVSHKSLNINQLGVIDSKNRLRLISTLNGNYLFQYELPLIPVNKRMIPKYEISKEIKFESDANINPLSQTEIETGGPYLNLVNNKNIQFAVYNFYPNNTDKSDFENFVEFYSEFGNEMPTKLIDFNTDDNSRNTPNDYLLNKLNEGLVINQYEIGQSNNNSNESINE